MHGLSTMPTAGQAAAGAIAGDAYLASVTVVMTGDGTSRRVTMSGTTFEQLMTAIEMRPQAFEQRTRIVRPHHATAITLMQRIDRRWASIDALDNPDLSRAAEALRELAELSDTVAWAVA